MYKKGDSLLYIFNNGSYLLCLNISLTEVKEKILSDWHYEEIGI